MTDDEVVAAIHALVAAGEHLDCIRGVPGARLAGGGVFADNRRLVVAERGQQHRTGLFRARAEFLEHLADERRFTAGVQVYSARVHGRSHGGPADLHERSRGRYEHVAGAR
jgi:hypothetical protein